MADSVVSGMPAPRRKVVIQISDVHAVGAGLLDDVVDPLDNLSRVLGGVEAAGEVPDAVIFSGDLADRGEPEAYRRFLTLVQPWAARLGMPVLLLPGNHDDRRAFRRHLLGRDGDDVPVDEPVDQVAWAGGLRIVALDSTVPGRPHGDLGPAQLSWLRAVLAAPAPLGTLLVLHHPPILGPSLLLNQLTLNDPERLADAVRDTDVLMVLAGHAHHASAWVLGGVPVWVSSATAYQMDATVGAADVSVSGRRGSAWTRVDVFDGSAVATHVALPPDEPPLYDIPVEVLRQALALPVPPSPPLSPDRKI